ncbi:MAG TPA: DNA/RNA non-specific endonuclease [Pyrinomonadaceae bacterium]|nr:DNA/RNA non-specific endonuclease [Pyrinomonadaceae bacterium]
MATRTTKKYLALLCMCALLLGGAAFFISTPTTYANLVAQPVPLTQNWSNTGLITTDGDWSMVPGIIGYRGDNLTPGTGTDPQTILADGSLTPVDVNANHSDPDTFLSGGVTEFDGIPNPAVALNGSGTADAPHIVINLSTSGTTAINVAYNLRDLDASVDNSIQPYALQYRIGNTGNYINLPGGFVADATGGPSQATLVTPVSVALPAACENQPLVQLRIMTTNAVGNDEWVGIDDINITGTGGGNTVLSGTGLATPSQVGPGQNSLLTVSVTPASNPASTGIAVVTDLSTIGLSASQALFDNGTNGDVTAGDNVFSFLVTVPAGTTNGQRSFLSTITDAQMRSATASINLLVQAPRDPSEHMVMGNPSGATTDEANFTNYLLPKAQYVMSYHRDRGIPNWVSWHLDSTWLGTTPRQDDFRNDPSLPAGWYQVQSTDYSGSGFDRGHHTPSGDRTSSVPDNSATFFMTNMMPQAPANNQGPWEELESYCRTLVSQGNELYIIAGGAGTGGTGSNGGVTNTVANGHVAVPAVTWKVIIVLPVGANDADRVFKTTRVIAVIMPNSQSIGINTPWRNFRTSVDRVEGLTGFNFFSNVRPMVQNLIERKIDQQ